MLQSDGKRYFLPLCQENGSRRIAGVRFSCPLHSRVSPLDESEAGIADYAAFIDVISSLSCYKWNASSLDEWKKTDAKLIPVKCGHRENKTYSAIDDEYFIEKSDPVLSMQCRVRMYLDAHKESIHRYSRYLCGSAVIVLMIVFLVVCVDEVIVACLPHA